MFTLYTCDSETVDCRNSLEADPNQSAVSNRHHYVKRTSTISQTCQLVIMIA